jgi:phosphate starvation-inducible protein PhoH
MNSNNNMIELQMELPIEHEKKVFGQFDEHIKILERSLAVTLISRRFKNCRPGIECSARKGMSDTASGALTPRK